MFSGTEYMNMDMSGYGIVLCEIVPTILISLIWVIPILVIWRKSKSALVRILMVLSLLLTCLFYLIVYFQNA